LSCPTLKAEKISDLRSLSLYSSAKASAAFTEAIVVKCSARTLGFVWMVQCLWTAYLA